MNMTSRDPFRAGAFNVGMLLFTAWIASALAADTQRLNPLPSPEAESQASSEQSVEDQGEPQAGDVQERGVPQKFPPSMTAPLSPSGVAPPSAMVPVPLPLPSVPAPVAGYGGWNMHVRLMADLDRDRREDVVAFSDWGVYTARSTGTGFAPPRYEIPNLSLAGIGRLRRMADVNNDGVKDIVAFNDDGVWTALATGTGGFVAPTLVLAAFGSNQGWSSNDHVRLMADINRDGREDIVGFGNPGVVTALSTGTGFSGPTPAFPYFGGAQGWRVDRHVRLMADINGDGRQDIVGFGAAAVWTALSTGTGFAGPTKFVADLGYNQGWRVEKHVRLMAHLNRGASFTDIVAFGDAGVWTAMNPGNGQEVAPKFVLAGFGYNQGWRVEKHVRLMADINNDGQQDIVGFGENGVATALSTGDGRFTEPTFVLAGFGYNKGWRVGTHIRLMADINADGCQDIVGFGDAGVAIALSTCNGGFAAANLVLADFGVNTPQAPYRALAVARVIENGVGAGFVDTTEADRILLDATRILQTNDGPGDVACSVILARTGNILTHAGPASIDSNDELQQVLKLPGNVKVVDEIDYCAGLNATVVGCASKTSSFPSLAVERILAVKEGVLWAHEYGHTKGLEHRNNADTDAVMHQSIDVTRLKINADECAAFRQ